MVNGQEARQSRDTGRSQQLRSILLTLVCLCTVLATACLNTVEPTPGQSSSGWTLDNNKRSSLDDFKGQVVVLDFYATWCEPCREETPHLVKLQQQYQEQGLQIIGLNVGGDDDHRGIPNYAREFGIQYPLGLPDDALVERYMGDNDGIPQAFVFNRSGRLVKRFVGFNSQIGEEVEQAVQAALAEKAK